MFFIVVLVISALALAGSAAYFSVYGLAQVFAGAFWSVIIMGASLETGKLVASSFLYRFWDKISILLRVYLLTAIIVLMGITSMGVAGYLTAAYQIDTVGLRDQSTQLDAFQTELDRLVERKAEMDAQVAAMPPEFVSGRQKLIKSFKAESDQIGPRIIFLQEQIGPLNTAKITKEAKVGPIIFISKVLGKETDDAIFWLVIVLVSVFDPLAVALTIAANTAIKEYGDRKKNTPIVAIVPTEPVVPPEPQDLSGIEADLTGLANKISAMSEKDKIRMESRRELND